MTSECQNLAQQELDRMHDIQLLLQELLKFFTGAQYLNTLPLKQKMQ